MKTTNINSNANAKKFHRNYNSNSNTNISRDKYAKSKQIENTVWQLAETALEAKQTPGRLFTYLCKKAGV